MREDVPHHHDFDEQGGLILHERSPINPKSIYATAKVAADFLTMNYHDAFGVPGVVTRMFNNYGPRQNPRYVTGTIITQALARETIELGKLEPLRDFCFCTDGVRGHLTVAAHGTPGDVYVYGQGENISMDELGRDDPPHRRGERLLARGPHGHDDAEALSAGRERRDGAPGRPREARRARPAGCRRSRGRKVSCRRSAGMPRTASAGSGAWTGCRRAPRCATAREPRPGHRRRRVPRLAPRRAPASRTGHDVAVPRRARLRPDDMAATARLFDDVGPSSCSTSPPRSAASARTAQTPAGTGTRT